MKRTRYQLRQLHDAIFIDYLPKRIEAQCTLFFANKATREDLCNWMV